MSQQRKLSRKKNKSTSLPVNEKVYHFTQKELDDMVYRVQLQAKIETVRQVVHHMIRIGALIVTDNMGSIFPLENRLNNWAALCSQYVTKYKSLIPTGRLAEVEERLCKEVPGWCEK